FLGVATDVALVSIGRCPANGRHSCVPHAHRESLHPFLPLRWTAALLDGADLRSGAVSWAAQLWPATLVGYRCGRLGIAVEIVPASVSSAPQRSIPWFP